MLLSLLQRRLESVEEPHNLIEQLGSFSLGRASAFAPAASFSFHHLTLLVLQAHAHCTDRGPPAQDREPPEAV